MAGTRLDELQKGLDVYVSELSTDSLVSKRVEVAVVTFGGSVNSTDWATAEYFVPPKLKADGNTPMGEAIALSIQMLKTRKATYRANGVPFYRPWIFLITDGEPTDKWETAAEAVKAGEAKKEFSFFCVGVAEANIEKLSKISSREPLKLKGLRFADLFLWLSNSQQSVSRSQPGDDVPLTNPSAPQGWASI
jgi:uncharacterized protein YegL